LADNYNYPIKQKELLISDIIEAFDTIYDKYENKEEIKNFVRYKTNSVSPKTRKTAKEFVLKHQN
jgi:hypothetical protein